eukprot:193451-Amorphochlora_amoeboformis.AAC.1
MIDDALRRPGRFDREILIPLPTQNARKDILRRHVSKWCPPVSENVVVSIAKRSRGFSGAHMRALCVEAVISAVQRRFPKLLQGRGVGDA